MNFNDIYYDKVLYCEYFNIPIEEFNFFDKEKIKDENYRTFVEKKHLQKLDDEHKKLMESKEFSYIGQEQTRVEKVITYTEQKSEDKEPLPIDEIIIQEQPELVPAKEETEQKITEQPLIDIEIEQPTIEEIPIPREQQPVEIIDLETAHTNKKSIYDDEHIDRHIQFIENLKHKLSEIENIKDEKIQLKKDIEVIDEIMNYLNYLNNNNIEYDDDFKVLIFKMIEKRK